MERRAGSLYPRRRARTPCQNHFARFASESVEVETSER